MPHSTIPPVLPPIMPTVQPRLSFRTRVKNYFLTGLIIVGPLAITGFIAAWVINLVDGWVKLVVPKQFWPDQYLPFGIPGLGLVIALIAVTLLGFLTANLIGRTLLEYGEHLLDRMPVVRSIYRSAKQIFSTVFSTNGQTFRKVGLVQYPGPGLWSIIFISAPPPADMHKQLPHDEYVSVYMPCGLTPSTGFYFFVKRSEIVEVNMSPDDAFKVVMSLGMIQPEAPKLTTSEARAAAEARI